MKEQIIEILEMLLLAGVLAIIGIVLRDRKKAILALVHTYDQKAENIVQGSGMGPEKKALVIAWLRASGETVNAWLDKEIDIIVKELNDAQAWAIYKEKSRND